MKTNFKKESQNLKSDTDNVENNESQKDLTPAEYEDFIIKSGAKGSFMIYRTKKKEDELGIDEL